MAEGLLLNKIRSHQKLSSFDQISLVVKLSVPSILAQISTIIMFYIDASMVGSLGASASASVGIISSTMWLFGGICSAIAMGFSVQIAHAIGANDMMRAKMILKKSYLVVLGFALLLSFIAVLISPYLPLWLGVSGTIAKEASSYFFIYALTIFFIELNFMSGSALRCSGNMKVPSVLNILMCFLDVIFNFIFIFPKRTINIFSYDLDIYGVGLGVQGAAVGTSLSFIIVSVIMTYYALYASKFLNLKGASCSIFPNKDILKKAFFIGSPMGLQHVLMCSAQIISTMIVAPLGTIAIAAHSFAITAESICYMPGNGIADAATTVVGQSLGAKRIKLTLSFAWISVFLGIFIMTITGIILFFASPYMLYMMTPDKEVQDLAVLCLRIEAFAEPMFATAIVSYGVFVGASCTFRASMINLFSMWFIRLTMAWYLAPKVGLVGVWIAMAIELCIRGCIFIVQLRRRTWLKKAMSNIHN